MLVTLSVPCPPRANDAMRGKVSKWRWLKYKQYRDDAFASCLAQLMSVHGWADLQQDPEAPVRRRVEFTRYYSGRERSWDRINFASALKPILDVLKRDGKPPRGKRGLALLWDDSEEWVDDVYHQVRVERDDPRAGTVEVEVSE